MVLPVQQDHLLLGDGERARVRVVVGAELDELNLLKVGVLFPFALVGGVLAYFVAVKVSDADFDASGTGQCLDLNVVCGERSTGGCEI